MRKGFLNTDKSDNYLNNYESFFSSLKDRPIKLLELGVYKGGSLLLWKKYFKRGTVVGIDIDNPDITFPEDVYFEKGDQRDQKFLNEVSKKYTKKGFDIIIDDASHFASFTEASFLICFKKLLKAKGIYVIEDWGTGYWEDWPDGKDFSNRKDSLIYKLRNNRKIKQKGEYLNPIKKEYENHNFGMVGFGKQLIDELAIDDIKKNNRKLKKYQTAIQGIYYSAGQIFIFKK